MQLTKSLSIVVVVIIHLLVLIECAVKDDDGKLIFAHVVSVLQVPAVSLFF